MDKMEACSAGENLTSPQLLAPMETRVILARASLCIYENGLGDAHPSRKSTVGIYLWKHAHSDTNTTEHLKYGVGRQEDILTFNWEEKAGCNLVYLGWSHF